MDNGLGIPKELKNRLIEPYVTTRTEGSGLGLAIVKKIMEEHNGELTLANRRSRGAIFNLIFSKVEISLTQNNNSSTNKIMNAHIAISLRNGNN